MNFERVNYLFIGLKQDIKTDIQRVDNREFLTAQTYIKNIEIDFVKIDALRDFAKVF